jgi:hypothetical protein
MQQQQTGVLDDLSWAHDAEPIINTHFGEGSAIFRWVGALTQYGGLS